MSLAVTGIPSSYRAPITAVELLFGQGGSSAGASRREAIYCVPKRSTGSAVANVVYRVKDEGDASTLGGLGSAGHRAARMHFKANKSGKVSMIFYDASSGGGLVSATGTFTVTVPGSISAAGILTFSVTDDDFSVGFTTASTPTTIGDSIAAKINAATHLPVTAVNAAGVVTMTAKIGGASQNGIYRLRIDVDANKGVTVAKSAVTVGVASGVLGVDGATTELTNLTAALAVLNAVRYYYIGVSVFTAAHLAPLKTHIVNKSLPMPGLRSRGFAGAVGTLSATATIATGLNYERLEITWQENSDHEPLVLAANMIAVKQLFEELEPDEGAYNFDNFADPQWLIKRAYADADWPDSVDMDDAVTDGITPIQSKQTGSFIGMSINTRSKDATGALDDFRASETHRVSCLDWLYDGILADHLRTYSKFKLSEDVLNADGSVNQNFRYPPKTITPLRYRPWYGARLQRGAENGLIQKPADWLASTEIRVDPANNSRLQVGSSGRTQDLLHQTTFRIAETTPN